MDSEIYNRVDSLEQENSELKQEVKDLRDTLDDVSARLDERYNALLERLETLDQHCDRAIDNHNDRLYSLEDRINV
jgi:uncharacterized protein YlxW (UPF0749 family)